jgi:hypothetical protein
MTTVGGEGDEPIALFEPDFYTDSIGDKSVQMLNPTDDQRTERNDQDQFSPGQGLSHGKKYPFIDEFSEFISSVSMDALMYQLMTHQQRMMAQAHWEAQNYGGSKEKCIKHLKEIYGPKWYQVTSLDQHMDNPRSYYEYVLIIDHQRQWDERKKLAKLRQTSDSQ